jgi:hypothetical protein
MRKTRGSKQDEASRDVNILSTKEINKLKETHDRIAKFKKGETDEQSASLFSLFQLFTLKKK